MKDFRSVIQARSASECVCRTRFRPTCLRCELVSGKCGHKKCSQRCLSGNAVKDFLNRNCRTVWPNRDRRCTPIRRMRMGNPTTARGRTTDSFESRGKNGKRVHESAHPSYRSKPAARGAEDLPPAQTDGASFFRRWLILLFGDLFLRNPPQQLFACAPTRWRFQLQTICRHK